MHAQISKILHIRAGYWSQKSNWGRFQTDPAAVWAWFRAGTFCILIRFGLCRSHWTLSRKPNCVNTSTRCLSVGQKFCGKLTSLPRGRRYERSKQQLCMALGFSFCFWCSYKLKIIILVPPFSQCFVSDHKQLLSSDHNCRSAFTSRLIAPPFN